MSAWAERRIPARLFYPLLFCLLVGVGLLLALPSLEYNWFSDDLYLVRAYSSAELGTSLAGTWQPASLGTRGYRPLTPLYYHISYLVSGGSPLAYHLEQIALFALMLIALALALRELGFSRWQVTAACLIVLCTRNTWWMLTWATDSVRLLMALLGNLALYAYLRSLKTGARGWAALAVIAYGLALLTREEALPYAVLIPLIGWWRNRNRAQAIRFGALLVGASAAFMVARRIFVPDAVSNLFLPGWLPQMSFALAPLLFNWMPVIGFVVLWALIALARPPRSVWFWLLCVGIAAAPGIIVWRGNNSLLPVMFMAVFLVSVFSPPRRWLHVAAIALYLCGSITAHRSAQIGLAPNSSERVAQAERFLDGDWQDSLEWMPPERLDSLRAEADTPAADVIDVPPTWSGW